MRTKCITSAKSKSRKKNAESDDLISVILLCDSPGHRMRSYGPVSLVSVNGAVRLIDLQIEAIKSTFNNFEIILCLGFDSDKVYRYIRSKHKDLNIRIVENQLYDTSNSCESLRLSLKNICNDKVLICDGNLIIDSKLLSNLSISTSSIMVEENPNNTLEIGLNIDNNIVQHFSFGAKNIWSEIIYLNGKPMIDNLVKILLNHDNKNRLMFEALNELLSANAANKFQVIKNPFQLTKINNVKTYHNIKG